MSNNDLVEIVRNHPDYQKYHSPEFDRVLEAMLIVDRKNFLPEKVPVAVTVKYQTFSNMINAFDFLMDDSKPDDERGKAYLAMLKYISKLPEGLFVTTTPPRDSAYEDRPLPIGYEQSCSQPSIVAFMAYWLELEKGMKVFELGYGCGYSAAITYHLIGQSGQLFAAEVIPPLAELGSNNLKVNLDKVSLTSKIILLGRRKEPKLIPGNGLEELGKEAPFDRIYLTAEVNLESFDPFELARHLNPKKRGILLFPESKGNLIKQIYEGGKFISDEKYGDGTIRFVPLIGKNT